MQGFGDGGLVEGAGDVEGVEEDTGRRDRVRAGDQVRGLQHQAVRAVRRAAPELGDPADEHHVGQHHRIGGLAGVGPPGQGLGADDLARLGRGLGGQDQTAGHVLRRGAQQRGALVRGRRTGRPAAGRRGLGDALQRGGDGLVGAGGRLHQVPGTAYGRVTAGDLASVQHRGQRGVGGEPLRERGAAEHGGAQQRMPEGQPPARSGDADQRRRLGGLQVLCGRAEPFGGLEDDRELARLLRGGDQQQRLRRGRQAAELTVVGELEPPRERQRPAGVALGARQLAQGERVSVGQFQQLAPGHLVGVGDVPGEHLRGCRVVQPDQAPLGQTGGGGRSLALPGGEQHHDALRAQPARSQHQRLRGGGVAPLEVVHEAEHGPGLGQLRKQPEHPEPHQQPVAVGSGGIRIGEAEGPLQRPPLRLRQRGQPVQRGGEQQLQCGERQIRLGLDTGRPQHRPTAGRLRAGVGVVQQRGLADSRLAAQHQHPAAPLRHGRAQQFVDSGLFGPPSVQHAQHPTQRPRHPGADITGPRPVTDTVAGRRRRST